MTFRRLGKKCGLHVRQVGPGFDGKHEVVDLSRAAGQLLRGLKRSEDDDEVCLSDEIAFLDDYEVFGGYRLSDISKGYVTAKPKLSLVGKLVEDAEVALDQYDGFTELRLLNLPPRDELDAVHAGATVRQIDADDPCAHEYGAVGGVDLRLCI